MWLIYVEALLAMLLFILIVWWTMFHGRSPAKTAPRPAPTPAPTGSRLPPDPTEQP
jgi:hypothetical protein